jgi:hypothetical protein
MDEVSATHDGWLVSLDILSPDIGAQPDLTDLPLVGITFEDIRAGTVTISAGRSAVPEITHTIQAPVTYGLSARMLAPMPLWHRIGGWRENDSPIQDGGASRDR